MSRLVLLAVFVAVVGYAAAQNQAPQTKSRAADDDEKLVEEQNRNAHYAFDVAIDDQIRDSGFQRQETRDGVNVKGSYSYNDGFFKRTIEYEADDQGYRVVNELVEPIGDGPKYNPSGKAEVSGSQIGHFTITEDDVPKYEQQNPKKL
ncbi:unnamed protein product [Hermetia illucens]|uniref:Uncharacterized protein n=1 Tax=Hermetia illucens TaxID=343691 RepID=A0A7R8UWC1_HERIL|nr:cuticle protein [Hermetia illucens]CAD7088315.1 unnamed protein product [Hermetia illucens]